MKVFIYHSLINNDLVRLHNENLARANNLAHHLAYLHDFYELFKQFETTSARDADYFFVPLFMAGWQFANHDPSELINTFCLHADQGRHLLLTTGDFGQRALSRYEMQHNPNRAYRDKYAWLDDRFILLALESTNELHAQDIAFLPYPVQQIPSPDVERNIYISFMGAMSYEWLEPDHVRGKQFLELKAQTTHPGIIIGTPADISQLLGKQISNHELMMRSVFTLSPAGYGRWSFRFVEALLNGSIPIIVSDGYVMPFSDVINWNECCVFVDEADLLTLESIVGAISVQEVLKRQEYIRSHRTLFEREFSLSRVAHILDERARIRVDNRSPADAAIARMRGPSEMGIICVDVTNKCDLACSNCTRLLENQDHFWEMTPENFRLALQSLRNYPGMIAMIGGNPCMHSKFAELCQIFIDEIPNQRQRGLWTNNIFKHQEVIESTFGGFNLNPHNMPRAIPKLRALYEKMVVQRKFSGDIYEGNSSHSPLLTAVKDLYAHEEMWQRIANCDINKFWSASITQNNGQPRVYFCEVAAAFDLARNQDHGFALTADWWRAPIEQFAGQIKRFCPGCGVPARLEGRLDRDEIDSYSDSNKDLAEKSVQIKKRNIVHIGNSEITELGHTMTDYAQGTSAQALTQA